MRWWAGSWTPPGVYASHGYERSHIDGVWNTLKVLKGYLEI